MASETRQNPVHDEKEMALMMMVTGMRRRSICCSLGFLFSRYCIVCGNEMCRNPVSDDTAVVRCKPKGIILSN